ncbi:hypothetical protein QW71_31585 [Paenibacillus sp. IHB B 3415]|nr:hypothetical protein QW71_31585 [Paenibacillus sp. IHB B 3415]
MCSLFHEVTMLPIFYMDANKQIRCSFPGDIMHNPLYSSLQEQATDWLNAPPGKSDTTVYSTQGLENYIVTTLHNSEEPGGWIIIGPTVVAKWPEELLTGLLHELQLIPGQRPVWFGYYRQLPVVIKRRLLHTAMLLHEWLTGQKLDSDNLIEMPASLLPKRQPAAQAFLHLADNRESGVYHHTPDAEHNIFKHIKSGDKRELIQAFLAKPTQKIGLLSKRSPLRHQKNLAVSVITLATRTAIEGGMFPEEAYTLSDTHIQHIEELTDLGRVEQALLQALGDFADGVGSNMEQRVSRPVSACQHYIFDHLYDDLSLSVLAKAAKISPAHLSRQFRKEVGVSLTEYVQRQQIGEAKQLLLFTDSPISDISSRLRFHDQSYFTKVFKKYTGVTPKQFQSR